MSVGSVVFAVNVLDTPSDAWGPIVPPFTVTREPLIATCVTAGTTFVTPKEKPFELHAVTTSPSSQYSAVRTTMSYPIEMPLELPS